MQLRDGDGYGAQARIVEMMDEGGGAEAPGLHDHAARMPAVHLTPRSSWACAASSHTPVSALATSLRELLRGSVFREFGPLRTVAAAQHLVDEDAEAFGGSCERVRKWSLPRSPPCAAATRRVSISAMPAISVSTVDIFLAGSARVGA